MPLPLPEKIIDYNKMQKLDDPIKSALSIRLFVGCPLNSEIKMHLNQSRQWKQTTISPHRNNKELIEIHHQGKDYLGYHLDLEKATLADLKQIEEHVKGQLQIFCPDLEIEKIKVCIFPQVFIA